jgi:TP901 family phage tail tape measure protein
MALNNFGLGYLFTATDNATGIMRRVGKVFENTSRISQEETAKVHKSLARLGVGMTAAFLGMEAIHGMAGLTTGAAKLETALAGLDKVTNASDAQLQAMAKSSRLLGKEMGIAQEDILHGMKDMAQQGYTLPEVDKFLPNVLKFAEANELAVSKSIAIMDQAIKSFGMDASFIPRVMDQIQVAANASALDVGQFAILIGRASAGVKLAKGNFTEMISFSAMAKNAMGSVEQASTATRYAFEALTNPKVQKRLHDSLGLDVLDKNKNFKGSAQALLEIYERLNRIKGEGPRTEFLIKAFGAQGVKAMDALFTQMKKGITDEATGIRYVGKEAINHFMDMVGGANGAVDDAFEKMHETFANAEKRLSESGSSLGRAFGEQLMKLWEPVIIQLGVWISELDEKIRSLDPNTQKLIAQIMTFGSVVLVAGGALMVLGSVFPLIKTGFMLLSPMFEGLGASILGLGWPILAIIAAVAAAYYLISNNIGGLGDVFWRVVDYVSEVAQKVWAILVGVWDYMVELWDNFSGGFSEAFEFIKPIFTALAESFNALGDIISEINGQFDTVADTTGEGSGLGTAFKWLGKGIAWLVAIFVSFVTIAVWVVNLFAQIGLAVWKFLKPALDWVGAAFDKLGEKFTWLGDSWKWFKSAFSSDMPEPPEPSENRPKPIRLATVRMTAGDDNSADRESGPLRLPKTSEPVNEQSARLKIGEEKHDAIDYDRLAHAVTLQPIVISIDGERLAMVIDRGRRRAATAGLNER